MNSNIITVELSFGKTTTVLTCRDKGVDCYDSQMKATIEASLNDKSVQFNILFPNQIKIISGSYLLGMFEVIYGRIGMDGIKQRFNFTHSAEIDPMALLANEIKRSGC